MAARAFGRTRPFSRRKASDGKTLDFDAGFTPCFLSSNSCLGCAITAAAARESERSVFVSCRVFGRAVSEITAILPQSAAAGAGVGAHRSPRQPADVHSTATDELRILGRRLGSSFMLSNAAVLLQHKPGAGGGRRESSDCLPTSPATVADAPDSLGRRRGPMHHLLERRRRRGPEPQGMLAAVAEDAVDP